MISEGFIFNHNKCVGCGACSAACVLENGWSVKPRAIYTFNQETLSPLPVVNISLACNHCEKPACLDGCPSGSFYREPVTGAIIMDEKKCLGCKYCQWNCPYDAPKYDERKKIIAKCNLCYSSLSEGLIPACSRACPTGALHFGEISARNNENRYSWFPDKNLNPSLELTGRNDNIPLRIIPGNIPDSYDRFPEDKGRSVTGEWSLTAFSFLATLSVSIIAVSIIKGIFPDPAIFLPMVLLSGISSLFHLGRATRAWRAVANLKTSPLSREIAFFLIYSLLSFISVIFELPALLTVSVITGFILLIIIDSVYLNSDSRIRVKIHSGQTFLTSLIIISFLTGSIIPFIFIAVIKLTSSVYILAETKTKDIYFGIRFLRILLLTASGASLISGQFKNDQVIQVMFLSGELIDRILFYIDFNPLNIKSLIIKHINIVKNEKQGG